MTDRANFELVSPFEPRGDQPAAIEELVCHLSGEARSVVLLGITGSGKTFTMANVIARLGRPTLVLAHNKTLAAQLFTELKSMFPDNAVEYFVSYYDYYQPEAYVPTTDTYIEKDSSINEALDRMRHSATRALLTRRDTIIVASVSCIYGIGTAEDYREMLISIEQDEALGRDQLLRRLVEVQYSRNDTDFARGTFRVRGDMVEMFPVYENEKAVRIEFFGDQVERISEIDPLRGAVLGRLKRADLFPGSHYVTPAAKLQRAIESIRVELRERLAELDGQGKLVEKQRLGERTSYDLEMLEQTGHCAGIENYSRHLAGRAAGDSPTTLLDYFPKDYLTILDESHQTVPQLQAMYRGDRSRKQTLVDFGFRLPSALDNRPLMFEEFQVRTGQVCFVSATPADFEKAQAEGRIVSQIIRPTGLLDPEIEVRPVTGQIDDLLAEVRERAGRNERVLVTTLTKRMAEDLTEYYAGLNVKVRYLHSDIDTLERVEILRQLRRGEFDVLVGINLLREGLDLPEVSLVAILDADKEGFLRSARSLIQTIGRASRNLHGKALLYADRQTNSMAEAIGVTRERRKKQEQYNKLHGITPKTIEKALHEMGPGSAQGDYFPVSAQRAAEATDDEPTESRIERLKEEMLMAAAALEFEKAAALRDQLRQLTSNILKPESKRAETRSKKRRSQKRRR